MGNNNYMGKHYWGEMVVNVERDTYQPYHGQVIINEIDLLPAIEGERGRPRTVLQQGTVQRERFTWQGWCTFDDYKTLLDDWRKGKIKEHDSPYMDEPVKCAIYELSPPSRLPTGYIRYDITLIQADPEEFEEEEEED